MLKKQQKGPEFMKKIILLSIQAGFLFFFGSSNCMHRTMAKIAYARNNAQQNRVKDTQFLDRCHTRKSDFMHTPGKKRSRQASAFLDSRIRPERAPTVVSNKSSATHVPHLLVTCLFLGLMATQIQPAYCHDVIVKKTTGHDIVGSPIVGLDWNTINDIKKLENGCVRKVNDFGGYTEVCRYSKDVPDEPDYPEYGSTEYKARAELGKKFREDVERELRKEQAIEELDLLLEKTLQEHERQHQEQEPRELNNHISYQRIDWGDMPVSEEIAKMRAEFEEDKTVAGSTRQNVQLIDGMSDEEAMKLFGDRCTYTKDGTGMRLICKRQ